MKKIAVFLSLVGLVLALSVSCYSQAQDVLGWQDARWGMSEKDIIRVFGSRLQKLSKREVFLKFHVDYVIPQFEFDGGVYTVLFQMADETNRLEQVLIRLYEKEARIPREQSFNSLASSLAREFGEPTNKNDQRYRFLDRFSGVAFDRTWKFPSTTVELSYDWDDQIYESMLTIRYFPTK